MSGEVKTPTGAGEKPHHYSYLKEFRVEQCPLFLQHKCTQHRPFTCFHWHFMNQRRRRPSKRRDGGFSYSPDVYCTNYDETTGICPDGDDCPLLHRTAGDTERRYHLRYYKTAPCVHETDSRGHCVKNGIHCAFSHGTNDLRPPVFDTSEDHHHHHHYHHSGSSRDDASHLPNHLDNNRGLAEDPKWQCTAFVLTNYKTDPCKRPPRLCRQGYACPQYHNNKDRRRSPKTFKYRSTPCPSVKHGDEWGEPTNCESGDQCAYCHTRTEQQFHPEIYKSTKCNDMLQTGYCPRGPFCAFAHIDEEINSFRDSMSEATGDEDHSLAGYLNNALSSEGNQSGIGINDVVNKSGDKDVEIDVFNVANVTPSNSGNGGRAHSWSASHAFFNQNSEDVTEFSGLQWPPQLLKGELTASMRREILEIENDANMNEVEKSQRRQEALQRRVPRSANPGVVGGFSSQHPFTAGPFPRHHRLSSTSSGISSSSALGGSGSPSNNAYFSLGDTVESVLANGLDDLDIDDLNIENLDKEIDHGAQEILEEPNSASSSFSASFGSPMGMAMGRSLPISIPDGAAMLRHQFGSGPGPGPPGFAADAAAVAAITASGVGNASPLSTLNAAALQQQQQHHHQQQPRQRAFSLGQHPSQHQSLMQQQLRDTVAAAAFLSGHAGTGKFGGAIASSLSPGSGNGATSSPLLSSLFAMPQGKSTGSLSDQGNVGGGRGAAELLRLQEEVISSRSTLAAWEECMVQARKACDAWKKEAEESKLLQGKAEAEKLLALQQRDDAVNRCTKLLQELERVGVTSAHMKCLQTQNEELEQLPIQQVVVLQQQLRQDLDRVEQTLFHHQTASQGSNAGGPVAQPGSQAPPPGFGLQQPSLTGKKPSPSN